MPWLVGLSLVVLSMLLVPMCQNLLNSKPYSDSKSTKVVKESLPANVARFFEKNVSELNVVRQDDDGVVTFRISGSRNNESVILEYAQLLKELENEGKWKIEQPHVSFEEHSRFFYILTKLKPS